MDSTNQGQLSPDTIIKPTQVQVSALPVPTPVPAVSPIVEQSSADHTSHSPHQSPARGVFLGFATIVIIVAIIAGYYYIFSKDGGYKLGYATPHYSMLNQVKVSGDIVGHGSSFLKPTEFINPQSQTLPKQNVDEYVYSIQKHKTLEAAHISLTSATTQAPSENFYKKYGPLLLHSTGDDFNNAFNPLGGAASARLGKEYTISYQRPKDFTSSYIKNHAWSVEFSATKISASSITPSKISGIVVMALGKNATYYFMISADKTNWGANSTTWHQVLDSLAIDQ